MACMKKFLFGILIVLTLIAADCEKHEEMFGPNDILGVLGAVGGFVRIDNVGARNITVTLTSESMSSPEIQTTGTGGHYVFDENFPGTYTVTISDFPPDVEFETTSQTFGISGNSGGIDFEGFRKVTEPITVDVLIFSGDAYPTSKFIEVGEEPGCAAVHWHSRAPVRIIARRSGTGFDCAVSSEKRKSDNEQRGCGHGEVSDVPRQRITLDRSCRDAYIDKWGPLVP